MIDGTRFAVFVSVAAILALTPGPGILRFGKNSPRRKT